MNTRVKDKSKHRITFFPPIDDVQQTRQCEEQTENIKQSKKKKMQILTICCCVNFDNLSKDVADLVLGHRAKPAPA